MIASTMLLRTACCMFMCSEQHQGEPHLRTTPADPIRVASSRGPPLIMASTRIWMGLESVVRLMMSKQCFTMRAAINFLPLLRPCIIREQHKLHSNDAWSV